MIRLQRFLAQAGVASRRKAEQLILAGRVRVNGSVVRELGTKVDPARDRVFFDRQRLVLQDHVWLVLHKPPQTVCTTSDPQGRQTVLDLVDIGDTRIYPVGRLDYHTSGVLLLTNDGELAQALLHPSSRVPRVYHVKVKGLFAPEELQRLRDGVVIDSGERVRAAGAMLASTGKHTWIELTLERGVNRQIHRMMEAIDREVLRLIRVEFAGIRADDLQPAAHRQLTQREVNELRALCGLGGETQRSPRKPTGGRRAGRQRRRGRGRRKG